MEKLDSTLDELEEKRRAIGMLSSWHPRLSARSNIDAMFRTSSRRRCLITVSLVVIATAGQAQDGRLVEASPIRFQDEQWQEMEASVPGIRATLEGVELSAITYLSDGLKVKGYLAVPQGDDKLPCVIFNRGGNREFGALTDERAASILGRLASWGYVAVASQYRGNAGGEGREEFGGAEVRDVLSLIPLLEAQPRADASRIGIYGWSRGGMMTYLALARTDRFAAAVVGAGSADAFDGIRRRPEMEEHVYAELVPDYAQNKDEALRARSAVLWPETLDKSAPILLLHGSADWRVHPTEALRMASALYESRHPFRFVFFEGGDHGLTEHRGEVDRLIRDWLDHYVRDGRPWPSLEPHGR